MLVPNAQYTFNLVFMYFQDLILISPMRMASHSSPGVASLLFTSLRKNNLMSNYQYGMKFILWISIFLPLASIFAPFFVQLLTSVSHLGGRRSSPLASAMLANRLEIWFPGNLGNWWSRITQKWILEGSDAQEGIMEGWVFFFFDRCYRWGWQRPLQSQD